MKLRFKHWGMALTFAGAASCLGTSARGEELTGTLQKIKESGTVTLGVRESSVPFSYLDDKQAYRGYSIDACMKIVDAIKSKVGLPKLSVKYQAITSATRIPLMLNQTIDLTCGSDANTLDRQRQVAFSYTTYVGNEVAASLKSSNIRTLDDLRGKTVVTSSGTTDIAHINELNQQDHLGMKLTVAADHSASFMTMSSGRASVFIITDIIAGSQIANAKNPDEFLMWNIEKMPVEPWALMMRRDDPQFTALVNGVLAGMFKSGEMNALYRKWFESPLPSLGINLRIPMSDKLRRAMAVPTDSGDPKDYK
ncbi:amino acid ABC transporter substrate-binding protein [Paraburkholderia sediminicola]|uniref:amino acid ABC transporter substrate-binding protein n=1 Tax=Paraburkholderia sediminicola TaxID=458836 RepID=UPI0038BD49E6